MAIILLMNQQLVSIDPTCCVSPVQAAAVSPIRVWGMFSGTLWIPQYQSACVWMTAWVFLQSLASLYGHCLQSSNGYSQHLNAPCHKAKVISTGLITWQRAYCTSVASLVTAYEFNRTTSMFLCVWCGRIGTFAAWMFSWCIILNSYPEELKQRSYTVFIWSS